MRIERLAIRARVRRTKRFLAACGLVGCLGGAAASSAFAESPAAPARSEQLTPPETTGDSAGRVRLRLFDSLRKRPIWSAVSNQKAEPTPAPARQNPFLTDDAAPVTRTAARTTAKARPAAVRVADGVQSTNASVRRVNHAETNPACAYPGGDGTAAATDAPSRGRASRDGRLPPAAPFGSTTPFAAAGRPKATQGETIPADATPIAARPAAPVKAASQTNTRRPGAPVPLQTFLTEKRSQRPTPGEVTNDDMIVNSALVPKRTDWRSETLPNPGEPERIDYPITPRQPFAAPTWQSADEAKPIVTANLPVTLSPSRTVETQTVSVANVTQTPADLPKIEAATTAPAAALAAAAPAATPVVSDNPFAAPAAPVAPTAPEPPETPIEEPALAALPAITPGPALPALSTTGPALTVPAAEPAATSPALATVTPNTTPTRLAEFGGAAAAAPVDLADAERALKKNQPSRAVLSTPLAVGLALAVVAIGAVMIRRRFT